MSKEKNSKITVAIDAMGGDNAPAAIIGGAAIFAQKNSNIFFRFFGIEAQIQPLIDELPALKDRYEIIHADQVISMDMQPAVALRRYRNSSMRLAVEDVDKGNSDFCVSAGNTGALMVISIVVLRTLQDIDRPAICAYFPTAGGKKVYVLDLGANVECGVINYVEFAIMGTLFCEIFSNIKNPRLGILNIGIEEGKGKDEIRLASRTMGQLKDSVNYIGYVEPDKILHDYADVVVTDGFTGNVTLKTLEGTLKFFSNELSKSLRSGISSRIGALLSKSSFNSFKSKIDPRGYNGATFLGLNGIVVKSHGGTDSFGFASAIEAGIVLAEHDYVKLLDEKLEPLSSQMNINGSDSDAHKYSEKKPLTKKNNESNGD